MTRPRLVATDLDGTALRTDGTISPRTATAFARVEQAGALLVFVTGRPPRWMSGVAGAVHHRGLAICANGALVYDLHTEVVVESHLIDPDVLAEVVRALRGDMPGLSFCAEYAGGYARESGFEPDGRDGGAGGGAHGGPETLLTRPCAKLLAQDLTVAPDHLLSAVHGVVGHLVTATHSSGGDGIIEMSARDVTKASALATLAGRHGITADQAVAFGDMPNDLPMLAWAGTSYAVANAHPGVLAAVDHVTAANDDDGVAVVLERLYDAPE
ncbi:HAD hydrolase family protein [Spongiactinospora sp. TRM90649]|uniref:HAD family hydrolase n=1 Tax=Spongiactinospora sp. TRM90649 TaxID=3031114 RepID=UPI0023F838D0|nr:HAD hydrolase family protein [Spongiactinospora sp. TRM90649]MDF5753007.1 HAD hydrolase family protein [Spongiactinospora sp. TRM90649]